MASAYGPRRFIAGAVCPRCSLMDKIVLYRVSDTEQRRECVRCGFTDSLFDDPVPEEPATRVNRPRPGEQPLAHEDEVQVVNIIDPGKRQRDH